MRHETDQSWAARHEVKVRAHDNGFGDGARKGSDDVVSAVVTLDRLLADVAEPGLSEQLDEPLCASGVRLRRVGQLHLPFPVRNGHCTRWTAAAR